MNGVTETLDPASSNDAMTVLLASLDSLSVEQLSHLISVAETARHAKKTAARQQFISEIRTKADALGIPLTDLLSAVQGGEQSPKQNSTNGRKLPTKYRGPNGEEWTGQGKTPRWLVTLEAQGRAREQFRV